ncbi:MAG: hypothetical protein MI922_12720, partial [Bacteroidales bacterium]|nr:hypothetical protein [Bacteroidales bacterium]
KYNLIPDGFPMAPRSKYNIKLQKRTATVRTTVKIPVTLSGRIGFNYPKKVKGHYWWGYPTTKVLDRKPGQEIINVTEETNLEFQWVKGPKKPL